MTGTSPTPRPQAFPPNWPARLGWIALTLYALYAASTLDVSWARLVRGIDQGATLLGRMFPPNTAADKLELITTGMLESLQIAVLATFFGILLSLPLGFAAARAISRRAGFPLPRAGLIAVCRSFHR